MRKTLLLGGSFALALALVATTHPVAQGNGHWVGTWATAVVAGPSGAPSGRAGAPPPFTVDNQTLREIVHVTLGGSRARVVLTNAFGAGDLAVGGASIAVRRDASTIDASTAKPLTFSGRREATIPAGALLVSDPVDLAVPAFADLAVDVYLPGSLAGPAFTLHSGAYQTSYVSEAGNHAGMAALPVARETRSWYFLSGVEVMAPANAGAVVTFGDSITDGTRSTPDMNHRWPDVFAHRLAARAGGRPMAVLNLGIAGNQVLKDGAGVSALARFDRDVAMQTGATHVIVMEAINDIGRAGENAAPSAADLIAGHQQIIERAHTRGLKAIGATLTPFVGAAYATEIGEAKREAVNQWIRTSGAYDGVIDFEKAVTDGATPPHIMPTFDPGDHLHFTDDGYQKMAGTIDLNLFR